MPVERQRISSSQFCELLALDPTRFRGVEMHRPTGAVVVILEPERGNARKREETRGNARRGEKWRGMTTLSTRPLR